MKKSLSIILALMLAASAAVSCGEAAQTLSGEGGAVETAPADIGETEEETSGEPQISIPAEDLGGIDITFFGVDPKSRQDWTVNTYSETVSEGENGDLINDAIFRRNLAVEELYSIHIKELSTTRENVGSDALKVILAGDDTYQVVNLSASSAGSLLNRVDALYNLYDIKTIDLSNPWWDKNSIETFTINGRLQNVIGDMSIRSFFSSVVLLMNKQMIENYGLESPFQLVADGKWVMDTMMDMAKAVTRDVDGDGKISVEDSAGYFGEAIGLLWGMNAMDIQSVTNIGGTPTLTLNTEKTVTAIEKYVKLLRSGEYGVFADDISKKFAGENIWKTRMLPMLMENQLLFYNHYLGSSLDLRSMDSDFGIIPMPKYDEAQETNMSSTHPQYVSFMTIPTTNAEPERTGKIVEAMEAYSSLYVVPAVYEKTLIGKVIRDNESEKMLDIIFANRIYDIGYIFNWGSISSFVPGFASSNKTDFASKYAKQESKILSDIEKYLGAVSG